MYANVEVAQVAREDLEQAMRAILAELASRARSTLVDERPEEIWPDILAKAGPAGALREMLSRWAEAEPRPLVLLIDEIDALVGDTLLSVMRQLRARYDRRPEGFPQRGVLCGGRIEREHGLGRRCTDLLIVWPQGECTRKFVIECKVLHKSLERTLREDFEQTVDYVDRCEAEAGHLVIFNRSEGRSWARGCSAAGGPDILVWGM